MFGKKSSPFPNGYIQARINWKSVSSILWYIPGPSELGCLLHVWLFSWHISSPSSSVTDTYGELDVPCDLCILTQRTRGRPMSLNSVPAEVFVHFFLFLSTMCQVMARAIAESDNAPDFSWLTEIVPRGWTVGHARVSHCGLLFVWINMSSRNLQNISLSFPNAHV